MNIVVNTRLLVNNRLDGIGIFARESLKRMAHMHPEHQFFFLFGKEYEHEFVFADNVTPILLPPYPRDPLTLLFWFEYLIPKKLRALNADIFLSPEPTLSLRTKVPSICVIHDLNYEHYPNVLPFHWNHYYRRLTARFAHKASRIATVSEYSCKDIVQMYGVNRNKIDIVYNGTPESFRPLDSSQKASVRNQFSGGSEYFYFVGTQQPRKNISNLFRAFNQFKAHDTQGIKLMMIGRKKWWDADIKAAWDSLTYKDHVIFPGRISDTELAEIAASALGLVYVPYFEGFGIPILEAFRAGTPVITANVTSMPEVAGNAALLVDPNSVEAIAQGMERVVQDPHCTRELIARGEERWKTFTWERTATLLWDSIERTLSEDGTQDR